MTEGDTGNGSKTAKERVTVLVCASMTGEKMPLLLLGKSKKPRCFRGVARLPVEYDSNRNAWMTATAFARWVERWDRRLHEQGRQIILLVDNCAGHPRQLHLQSIRLEFLPEITTAIIQPCDQGISAA